MFKILTGASLLFASFAIRFEADHEQTTSTAITLNDDQKKWDDYYRSTIKALGDSQAK